MTKTVSSLLAVLVAGCTFDIDPDSALFMCESDADCGEGYKCAQPWSAAQARLEALRCIPVKDCVPAEPHCNGADDDCDGQTDEADEVLADVTALRGEGPWVREGADCRIPGQRGNCAEGVARCAGGVASCVSVGAQPAPTDDDCDGFDDDCDGDEDEDAADLRTNQSCGGCGQLPDGTPTDHLCASTSAGAELERCVDGVCVESPLACSNGSDDDEDGRTDCDDPDCQGATCGTGNGFTCVLDAAAGQGECRCPSPVELCGNVDANGLPIDDDCDGRSNCGDSDCTGQSCDADPGLNCGASGCVPRESACDDATDGDQDGATDCDDLDCQGLACSAGNNCGMQGASPACVPVEAACGNGADEDGDGTADCDDDDCLGRDCDAADPTRNCGEDAAGNRSCVARETACGDDADDDRDGLPDCADDDCDTRTCGAGCVCRGGSRTEDDCGDLQGAVAVDNDADGQANCADLADCAGRACGTGCTCIDDAGTGRAVENACGDGTDNDADGMADCADPDCALQDCSAAGSPGCVCEACPGGVCPTGEVQCEDGLDNDADALRDCEDPDCDGLQCLGTPGCVCTGGASTEAASACADGLDNDADLVTDCADADCDLESCGAGCECAGGQATEAAASCEDGADNDLDLATDCADDDCDGDVCGTGCVCAGLLPTEAAAACDDGQDNDSDSDVDCADPDCAGDPCGTGCSCAGGVRAEDRTACGDVDAGGAPVDNDRDGQANCADPDCAGADCAAIAGACTCTAGAAVETACGNGDDDDADGDADCADGDCAGVAPCPVVQTVTPADGPAWAGMGLLCGMAGGDPLQALVVTGDNFAVDDAGAFDPTLLRSVTLSGIGCLNAVAISATEVHCETPAHVEGVVDVTVTNEDAAAALAFAGTGTAAFTFTTMFNSGILGCTPVTLAETATAGQATPVLVAQVNEPGETDQAAGPSTNIVGEVGFGPAGSAPECDGRWTWFPSTADASVEPQTYDLHQGGFTAPAAGTYGFIFRFSVDRIHWLYCDTDGAAGIQPGVLTVN